MKKSSPPSPISHTTALSIRSTPPSHFTKLHSRPLSKQIIQRQSLTHQTPRMHILGQAKSGDQNPGQVFFSSRKRLKTPHHLT